MIFWASSKSIYDQGNYSKLGSFLIILERKMYRQLRYFLKNEKTIKTIFDTNTLQSTKLIKIKTTLNIFIQNKSLLSSSWSSPLSHSITTWNCGCMQTFVSNARIWNTLANVVNVDKIWKWQNMINLKILWKYKNNLLLSVIHVMPNLQPWDISKTKF